MRTRVMRGARWCREVLLLLLLSQAGSVFGQAPPVPYSEERPAWLVMIGRIDPNDPSRYIGVFGDEQSQAVAFFRGGQRWRTSVPQVLERDDEFETAKDVMAVIRYPIGDVYVDASTRVRIGSLDVLFGKVFARVRGFFSVENQNVVAGVEGTEFAFEVARDGATQIVVLDGTVLSSSKRLPWKPLRVTGGRVFSVTDSGMQMRVGAAPQSQLVQLRRWVDRADDAVAVLAPREAQAQPSPQPPPQPPPLQPVPQPIPQPLPQPVPQPVLPPIIVVPVPPVVTVPSGYCCDTAGRVYFSTPGGCRGRLYETQAEAYGRCASARVGFCCANGRVFESTAPQCRGVFSYDQGRVRESCTVPPQPAPGYCCVGGELTQATRNQCKGNFYTDAASARRLCKAPPPTGYCCAAGQILRIDRSQCRGNYYVEEAAARKACTAPPEQGYCCAGGKVSPTTRDRCAGSFSRSQSEALKACKAVILAPKPDAVEKSQIIKKPPPSEPRVN